MNKIYLLAQREKGRFNAFSIGALEINYLDKRKPWIAVVWSMAIPSLGQLYLHRILSAAFLFISMLVIVWQSNLILAIHCLILGDVVTSSSVLDKQWLLYVPSYYFFSIYDAYTNTVEMNKLFDDAQRQYLIEKYQPVGHLIAIGDK